MTARGRPSTYNQEIGEEICVLLEQGRSLRSICGSVRPSTDTPYPSMDAVYDWLRAHEAFSVRYALARERQGQSHGDRVTHEAERLIDEGAALGGDEIQARKVAIDALKWAAGKLAAKTYGDRAEKEPGSDKPLIINVNLEGKE